MRLHIDDDIDLDAIARSGQCFRWEKQPEGGYRIPFRDRCLYIIQTGGGDFELSCDQGEFDRVWRTYFDLDENYSAIRRRIVPSEDPFLHAAACAGKGIRILRQDPWEITVSFIISQNRNIPAIVRSVDTLCRLAGKPLEDCIGKTFYTFPTAEEILALPPEATARCALGYRDKYVLGAARAVRDGFFDPDIPEDADDTEALERLTSLYGVGEKVACCIALFGLHRLDAFPVDTWIRKALENEYPNGFPADRYRPFNGVYQQYIFAYYREKTV